MQHLFFKCPSVKKIIKEIEAIFNCSPHLIWHFGFIFCLKIPLITFIFNWSGDIVVFGSFTNCRLSLIFKVTLTFWYYCSFTF
jgi:hypothetical protein